jgi:hypothetical protein
MAPETGASGLEDSSALNDLTLEKIAKSMGKQPWPTGQAARTALALDISKREVNVGLQGAD